MPVVQPQAHPLVSGRVELRCFFVQAISIVIYLTYDPSSNHVHIRRSIFVSCMALKPNFPQNLMLASFVTQNPS